MAAPHNPTPAITLIPSRSKIAIKRQLLYSLFAQKVQQDRMVVPESYWTTTQLFTELILKTSRVTQPFSNGDAMVTFGRR
jgi:hypothetical protein